MHGGAVIEHLTEEVKRGGGGVAIIVVWTFGGGRELAEAGGRSGSGIGWLEK